MPGSLLPGIPALRGDADSVVGEPEADVVEPHGLATARPEGRVVVGYGGLGKSMPGFTLVFGTAMLSSIGLPLLNGFIGEFTILRGVYLAHPWWAGVAIIGIVLSAAYMLSLYRHTVLGPITHEENRHLPDLSLREWAISAPLIGWAIWIGVRPDWHFHLIEGPVEQIMGRLRP